MRIELEDESNKIQEIKEEGLKGKHESDLTRKEKMQLEREKLKSMNFLQKLEYIWEYYKGVIFGIIAGIVMICVAVEVVENIKTETVLDILVIDAAADAPEETNENIEEILGIREDKYKKVTIETSLVTEANGKNLDMYANMAFVTKIQAQTVDVVVMPESFYEAQDKGYYFTDLGELLGEEVFQSFGDSGDNYHIVLNDGEYVQSLGAGYDSACIAVVVNSKHMDHAAKWIVSLQN